MLAADEPEPAGADSGPGPYDLLLAALGACTSTTVRMYAARKGWPLEKVTVSLRNRPLRRQTRAERRPAEPHHLLQVPAGQPEVQLRLRQTDRTRRLPPRTRPAGHPRAHRPCRHRDGLHHLVRPNLEGQTWKADAD
ncbi:OsmC family protein [Streptomyces flavofungini]|uniref:OsmC family protein n=1 Tax=Streptomyces flavofungini TaxID=68200 RepID=UPI001E5E00A9|nr:OsmC family protein [Streptomyces flavofungini]